MKKTIFYISLDSKELANTEGDYWFDNKPYKKLLEMENFLYEPNGEIEKEIMGEDKFIKSLTVTKVEDRFSNEGIVRRIAFYISK